MSEQKIPFNQIPNIVAGRDIYRLDSFTVVQYDPPAYRGLDTFECGIRVRATNLRALCYLDFTYEDAYLLGLHLMKLGESGLSAHERMSMMKGLEDSKDGNSHA